MLRIGVLGAARIAPIALYAPAQLVDGVRVVAVAARDRARAEKVARKHNIARVHASYDALLDDPDVDAVYIPLPNGLHAPWAIKALDQKKHVLCEKPLASNEAEARAMADAASKNARVLVEAFHWRFHPMAARMVAIVNSGELGDIRHIDTAMCIPLPLPGDIRYRFELGGGALMDTGAYAVHMLRTLAGAEPTITSASVKLSSPRVDRYARAEVMFANGAVGSVTCSLWSWALFKIEARVVGSRATMIAFNPVGPQYLHKLTIRGVDGNERSERFDKIATYTCQLRAFADAVRDGRTALCGPDDSIANMRAIDAIYRAAGLPLRGT
ncbi:MAG TPA: Gfo/Idh/MocA family oxidoreductase [Myxococcota bacterium]|jgi:predicted dehydrogenase